MGREDRESQIKCMDRAWKVDAGKHRKEEREKERQ